MAISPCRSDSPSPSCCRSSVSPLPLGLIIKLAWMPITVETTQQPCVSGFTAAQFNLGQLYANGQGVPQDYVQARQWWEKAAAQGDANAQVSLGALYDNGQGVPKNYKTAVYWFRLSANQGNAMALTNLGLMYEGGNGVPQDVVLAQKWYILGAARGDKLGAAHRDALAKHMTPVQLFQAQQRAREWKPKGQ
jgi:uncharacterized protein